MKEIKYDRKNIPYRSNFEKLFSFKKRLKRAIDNLDIDLLVAMAQKNHIEPNFRVDSLERSNHLSSYQDNGYSLLHIATIKQNKECVKQLLLLGANPNIKTFFKETPAHSAAKNCNLEILSLLVEFGADLKLRNAVRGNFVEDYFSTSSPLDVFSENYHEPTSEEKIMELIIKQSVNSNSNLRKTRNKII